MRTIVDIPERERGRLDALARRCGLSRAELIRRAIAAYLEREQENVANAFGIWRDRVEDGIAYQERLREEWQEPGVEK